MAAVYDALARCYASVSEWKSAAVYLQQAVDVVAYIYGEESIEAGNEYFKLAQLLFNAQELLEAINTVEKAKRVLQKHQSLDSNQLQELENMRKVLLQTIEQTVGPYWST